MLMLPTPRATEAGEFSPAFSIQSRAIEPARLASQICVAAGEFIRGGRLLSETPMARSGQRVWPRQLDVSPLRRCRYAGFGGLRKRYGDFLADVGGVIGDAPSGKDRQRFIDRP
jgi:hypothetical protein